MKIIPRLLATACFWAVLAAPAYSFELKLPEINEAATLAWVDSQGLPAEKIVLQPGGLRQINRSNYYNLTTAVSWDNMRGGGEDFLVEYAAFFLPQTVRVQSPGGNILTPATALYFMTASGCNNANSGLSPAAPWCTPNHPVNAGDIILAQSGAYNGDFATWGTVSNTPSTAGGLNGTGGVTTAILLCAASDIEGCSVNCATAACNAGAVGSGGRNAVAAAMNVGKSYWAIVGWSLTSGGTGKRGFQMDACLTTSTIIHHIALVNSKVYDVGNGWGTDDCGYGSAVPGNGVDYAASLGVIYQNASQDAICLAALDFVGPAVFDTVPGTHTYMDTNYVINSQSTPCITVSDSEAMMLDTLDGHAYSGQIEVTNNMAWLAMRNCFQFFYQLHSTVGAIVDILNNTCYGNLTNIGSDFTDGELNFNTTGTSPAPPYTVTNQRNIAQTSSPTSGSGPQRIYAALVGGGLWSMTYGGSGNENVLKGSAGSCIFTCDPGNNQTVVNSNPLGTQNYTSPAFTNLSDLGANWAGVPNCSGKVNTTRCMGWDATTSALTSLTPIADLVPTTGGMTTDGFQKPSTTCVASFPKYPQWLRGLNVPRASAFSLAAVITIDDSLAIKLCGT